jgi:hypothetical protein
MTFQLLSANKLQLHYSLYLPAPQRLPFNSVPVILSPGYLYIISDTAIHVLLFAKTAIYIIQELRKVAKWIEKSATLLSFCIITEQNQK